MRDIVAVSRCMALVDRTNEAHFHFIGVYLGQEIELIVIKGRDDFVQGEDYLLYIKPYQVKDRAIIGKVMRSKLID